MLYPIINIKYESGDDMLQGLKSFRKDKIKTDILSGIIIALVSIPISMGYAQIAGLPPQYGLYGSVIPVFLFAVLSSSPQCIFGVDAAPAALVGGTLASLGIVSGSEEALTIVPIIAFFTGIWLLLFSLMKFGSLTRFVSSPVMGGFISGICCTIILMQIPKLFGGQSGTGEIFELVKHILKSFNESFNAVSLVLSVFCIAVIMLSGKFIPKIPMSAIVMLLAAGGQFLFNYCEIWGINTLPKVAGGLGKFSVPNFTLDNCYYALTASLSISVVIASETLLAEKNFALKNSYAIDDNNELLAFSVCNIAAAFIGVCPLNGSVSRTTMNDRNKGTSQIVSLTAAGVMLLILMFAAGFIGYLPVPVLTSIVVCALWSGTEFELAHKLAKSSRKEMGIFIAAFLGVLVFGTIYGVVIGVLLSFLNVIIRESAPPTAFLGVIPGRNHFYNIASYAKSRPIEKVVIYRFKGNLFFANVEGFRRDIENSIKDDTRYIIVDASGIGSIDTTGAQTLDILYKNLKKRGIRLFLVEHISKVNEELRSYGLGYIIEEGSVRKTITDALEAVGYSRPYKLSERTDRVSEDTAILQEFEWAFGSDAQKYIDINTERIIKGAKEINIDDKNELFHLWDSVSPISDHILLDYMEQRVTQLAERYDIGEEAIKQLIKLHREAIPANSNKSE